MLMPMPPTNNDTRISSNTEKPICVRSFIFNP